MLQEAADATQGAQRAAKNLRTAGSPYSYLVHLTAAAAEEKAHMAAMIQSVEDPGNPTDFKKIQEEAIVSHAISEIALNAAAEAFHATATVDAIARPDDEVLQDRLAAAATLVVALRGMATDSYNTANSLDESNNLSHFSNVPTYAEEGHLGCKITLTSIVMPCILNIRRFLMPPQP